MTFQEKVKPWLKACFGDDIANDPVERNPRFLEESLELVQSTGCTQSEAHQLVDYVFNRDIGDPHQETGGVMVTLAALCLANGLDMKRAGKDELFRIWGKVDQIREKQANKPKHSPLPQHVSEEPSDGEIYERGSFSSKKEVSEFCSKIWQEIQNRESDEIEPRLQESLLSFSQEELSNYFGERGDLDPEIKEVLEDLGIAPPRSLGESLQKFAAREISDLGVFERISKGTSSILDAGLNKADDKKKDPPVSTKVPDLCPFCDSPMEVNDYKFFMTTTCVKCKARGPQSLLGVHAIRLSNTRTKGK